MFFYEKDVNNMIGPISAWLVKVISVFLKKNLKIVMITIYNNMRLSKQRKGE